MNNKLSKFFKLVFLRKIQNFLFSGKNEKSIFLKKGGFFSKMVFMYVFVINYLLKPSFH